MTFLLGKYWTSREKNHEYYIPCIDIRHHTAYYCSSCAKMSDDIRFQISDFSLFVKEQINQEMEKKNERNQSSASASAWWKSPPLRRPRLETQNLSQSQKKLFFAEGSSLPTKQEATRAQSNNDVFGCWRRAKKKANVASRTRKINHISHSTSSSSSSFIVYLLYQIRPLPLPTTPSILLSSWMNLHTISSLFRNTIWIELNWNSKNNTDFDSIQKNWTTK